MAMAPGDNVRTFTVGEDDDGIRLDRWFKRHLPDISFNLVSRWARTGQLRVHGKRAAPGDRLETGQVLRVPPAEARKPADSDRSQRLRRQNDVSTGSTHEWAYDTLTSPLPSRLPSVFSTPRARSESPTWNRPI